MQAYANLGVTCPTTKAFLLAMAEAACARESYTSVTHAGWALTVIQALPEDMLRRVRLLGLSKPRIKHWQASWALTLIQALPGDMLRRVRLFRPFQNSAPSTGRPAGRLRTFWRCLRRYAGPAILAILLYDAPSPALLVVVGAVTSLRR